ncbi:MAG: hypothetical protein R3302_01495 [Sulfurimonadaceae bacterium]|nr:hypothetical protein [Sulfurimonadaceae bacterium]
MKKVYPLLLLIPGLLYGAGYRLDAGLKTTAYDYTETYNGIVLDTEDSSYGDIAGGYARFELSLTQNRFSSSALQFYASHTEGETRYIGSILGSGQPYGSYVSTTENTFDELQANYLLKKSLGTTDYQILLGAGFYEWERALSVIQVETYYWYYLQMGIGMEERFYNGWSLGLDLTGQYALSPKMDADLPGIGAVTFDLGDTYTVRTGVPLKVPVAERLELMFRLEYEYTIINHSNIIGGYFEPDSEQGNWHLYAGVSLRF